MKKKYELSVRLTKEPFHKDPQGSVFVNSHIMEEYVDLTGFNVVHTGIDTLKQKFKGQLDESLVMRWLRMVKDNRSNEIQFINHTFWLSYAPHGSGYRLMIKNKSLGIHSFIGGFHSRDWVKDGIAKIEFSPNLILEHGLSNCHTISEQLADEVFLNTFEFSGVESHFCVDVQGWKPEQQFLENVTTYSKIKRAWNDTDISIDHLGSVAQKFADSQSFLIGQSGSNQLAVYNKTADAKAKGKTTFWRTVYQDHPLFDKDQDVYRVELRMHDSVIKHLGAVPVNDQGLYVDVFGDPLEDQSKPHYENAQILSIADLIPHVRSLWQHGLLNLFRYHYENSNVVRPEWQFLIESVAFYSHDSNEFFYKRVENMVKDDSISRNITQALGHLTSAFAKANIPDDQAIEALKKLPVYQLINEHYHNSGMSEDWWQFEFLKKLEEKRGMFAYQHENPFKHLKGYKDVGGHFGKVPF